MDFNKYYNDQAQGLDGYHAPYFQKGHGIGSLFKKFFRWVIPIIHENAEPIVKKSVGSFSSNVSKSISNFVDDLKANKPIGQSANERFNEAIDQLKRNVQTGNGKNKKIKRKSLHYKPALNYKTIFD